MTGVEQNGELGPSAEPKDEQGSREEIPPHDVEVRLRREMAKFREQARSAQAERDTTVAALRVENDARLIRSELRVAAIKSGIIDVDALRLVDTAGLTVGLDGTIEGAEGAIAAFKASKPYLFEDLRSNLFSTFTTSQPRRPPTPAQPDPVDARKLSREQWQAERAKVLSRTR